MKERSVSIIGGGIGGLSTAIALRKIGVTARVYEQAQEFRPVGAGILLACNAMQIYQKLGLDKIIKQQGTQVNTLRITDANLRSISEIDLGYFERKYKATSIAIHRADLHNILSEEIGEGDLYLDHSLELITRLDNHFELKFTNGKTLITEVVIGADGIHSTLRDQLFTGYETRTANQVCWRGIADFDLPIRFQSQLSEAWGSGDRFGLVQLAPGLVYWYALKTTTANETDVEYNLGESFRAYHPIVTEVISATPTLRLHKSKIQDIQSKSDWYIDNACLVGDAAHATTPNMGQGACQAIEDAYVLSHCVSNSKDFNAAFHKYQTLRRSKVNHVVNTSWRLGQVSHWENAIARKIRDSMMKITPPFISRAQSDKLFRLEM